MDADPQVVLDLDEQVGQPDQATAGVQPERPGEQRVGPQGRCARLLAAILAHGCGAVHEAVRLHWIELLGRVLAT